MRKTTEKKLHITLKILHIKPYVGHIGGVEKTSSQVACWSFPHIKFASDLNYHFFKQ